ncbi:MAG: SpoIIE family protein phosphatase [Spirochaetota bacterium]
MAEEKMIKKEKKNESKINKGKNKQKTQQASSSQGVRFSLRLKFSLAIIILAGSIIAVMTYYFIQQESELLRKQILQFANRETQRLAVIARESISQKDELPLVGAVQDLKNLEFVDYIYVLNNNNRIIQNFDPEKNGTIIEDDLTKKATDNTNTEKPLLIVYKDVKKGINFYDLSLPLFHTVQKVRIGTVRLGFSEEVILSEIKKMTITILLIGSFFIGLSVVGSIVLSSVIIKPIQKLTEGAVIIGNGNLDYKIQLNSTDEIGKLASEFNQMTERLKVAQKMEIESRIMQEQIDLAREIQEGLNPKGFYNKKGIEIKGFTRAAKGVGGDYFDYIDIDQYRVGALISDVSGKGVPASLVMVMIRTVFVSYIRKGGVECADVVKAINDALSADFAVDKFATLFFMIYDRSTHELAFSNAGHGPLFCYRSALNACTLTKLDGVPIGIMEDVDYKQAKVPLNVGDIVVLYTDGVTEMRNSNKEEYGQKRLKDLIIANKHLNAKEMADLIVQDVDNFRGEVPPHDDMTLLILKRTA